MSGLIKKDHIIDTTGYISNDTLHEKYQEARDKFLYYSDLIELRQHCIHNLHKIGELLIVEKDMYNTLFVTPFPIEFCRSCKQKFIGKDAKGRIFDMGLINTDLNPDLIDKLDEIYRDH